MHTGPCATPKGAVEEAIVIRNDIYFVCTDCQWFFCISKQKGSKELTDIAVEFGRLGCDGYLYYDLKTCAIPLYELQHYPEISNLFSIDSLMDMLWNNFAGYALICKIKKTYRPTNGMKNFNTYISDYIEKRVSENVDKESDKKTSAEK